MTANILMAFFPVISFWLLVLVLCRRSLMSAETEVEWTTQFLRSSVIWGVFVWLSTEVLSALDVLRWGWLLFSWMALIAGVCLIGWPIQWPELPIMLRRMSRDAREETAKTLLVIGIGAILMLTGLVAVLAPPQESDALAYHLGRVMHWLQNENVRVYATADSRGVWMPPWPSYAVLHLYALRGGDQLVNLVQWFSMLGSIVAVRAISGELGIGRKGQLISAAFAATLPFGIDQATNTLTDFVAAFWAVTAVFFGFTILRDQQRLLNWILIGSAVGLSLLSKPTGLLFALPVLAWQGSQALRVRFDKPLVLRASIALVIAILMNGPLWIRNFRAFENFIAPKEFENFLLVETIGIRPTVSNLVKNLVLHTETPFESVNDAIARGVRKVHEWMHYDVLDPRSSYLGAEFDLEWLWPGQRSAPLHAASILIGIVLLWRLRSTDHARRLLGYGIAGLAGMILFSAVVKWQAAPRFQLAFFLILSPAAAFGLTRTPPMRLPQAGPWVLIIVVMPVLLSARWRPLIGFKPYTVSDSIFSLSRGELLYLSKPELRDAYDDVSDRILESACRKVGIRMNSHDLEYLLWHELQALKNDIEVRHIHFFPGLEAYQDPNFKPCAVICTICLAGRSELDGLPINMRRGETTLFLEPESE